MKVLAHSSLPNCWILPIFAPIPILRGCSHGALKPRRPLRARKIGFSPPTPNPGAASLSGGILMKHFLFVVAMLALATTGCAGKRMMGCGDPCCGAPSCDPACGCCEPECGVCDPCCGDNCCTDGCCTDGSCGANGCGLGRGGCGLGGGACGVGNGCGAGGGRQVCGACGGGGCQACGGCGFVGALASGFCPHAGGYPESYNFTPGPPVGQTAYPYYTTRGPRDFLQNNPPSIGPY